MALLVIKMNDKKILSIVGKSNVGKTTLIEKMLPIFTRNYGIKVGTIKHHLHDFECDIKGKDSWRHQAAGAVQTIISSPEKYVLFSKIDKPSSELSIDELAAYLNASDFIITDGYKFSDKNKIEVFRPAHYDKLVTDKNSNLIAYATDNINYKFPLDVPVLDLNNPAEIVDFIVKYYDLKIKIKE
mgnify:CR=1 FL=1